MLSFCIHFVVINALFYWVLVFVGCAFGYKSHSHTSPLETLILAFLLFVPLLGAMLSVATALNIILKSFKSR
ncbi:hypothetical protein LMG7974_01632 [Campylobacter majalis]|uniref:TMhelix containing protein n=1 Tax=Campylobacter majalis TaxID=2790656 RepID=A0ABN7KCE1_9BACT|nr:hypothetical protein [Campylobacter majalis]CAD7289555.1 hypothetical protein LMG7974_01632 [Campylobacter majalis]